MKFCRDSTYITILYCTQKWWVEEHEYFPTGSHIAMHKQLPSG